MADIEFSITRLGQLSLVRNDLAKLSRSLRQNRALFGLIRDRVIRPTIERRFQIGGDPDNKWKDVTLRARQRRKPASYNLPPLNDIGIMRRLASAKTRFTISKNEMKYGNWPPTRAWAPVHDLGGRVGWGYKMPARPWSQLTKREIDQIEDIRDAWLTGEVLKHMKESGTHKFYASFPSAGQRYRNKFGFG